MSNETVKTVEPEKEIWRNFADQIGGKEWYRVSRAGDIAHVLIFNEVSFGGEHWVKLGAEIGDAGDIRLTIKNCLGGDSILALTFYEAYQGRVTQTRIIGKCHSAALTIALSGKKILMQRDAEIMVHAPHSFCYAAAGEMMQMAQTLAKTTLRIFKILKQRTECPDEIIHAWLDGMDITMTAEQAKGFGLIDEIFDPPQAAPASVPALDLASSTLLPAQSAPETGPTEDEEFIFDLLRAVTKDGAIKVRSKRNFARELKQFAQTLTIEEKSN